MAKLVERRLSRTCHVSDRMVEKQMKNITEYNNKKLFYKVKQ